MLQSQILASTVVWSPSKKSCNHISQTTVMEQITKGGFFQKVRFVFQISQSPKKYSIKLSWTWNSKFPPITVLCYGWNFKFQVQGSFFGISFWGRFGDLKKNRTFWKKAIFRKSRRSILASWSKTDMDRLAEKPFVWHWI